MVKSRKMPVGRHEHCDKCFSVYCQVPVQISVSCMVIKCQKNCGAILHKCKQEEHELLCPNESVPCLNGAYGCPVIMPRHRLAKHLEVCPASVVCCSQEWNRWPVSETEMTFCKNVSEKLQTEVSLDVAVALRDQELLFRSIKMKNIFPELMAKAPAPQEVAPEVNSPAEEATCFGESAENACRGLEENELSQEEREALAKRLDIESIQKYNSWEKIFKKEMDGCKETVKPLNRMDENGENEQESSNCQGKTGDSHLSQANAAVAAAAAPSMGGATGLAPWQDGVLERLGKEVNIAEYNMYLVHNGAMLINFGQLAACTPREKDFVYGKLEPIEVKTVRTFNIPTSYRAKRHHKDPTLRGRTVHQSVDTADLGMSVENLPKSDEVSATLLCTLEKELKGHFISESGGSDGLYVDIGTQTYNFASAPFKADASLADVAADRPHGLHVRLEAESVTRRHNRTSSAFSFMCGHFFRRDECRSHFRNVHSDIQASLSGWFQKRCPLAYLGCTFTQARFHPAGQQATIRFCRDVGAFVLQPEAHSSHCEVGRTFIPQRIAEHNLDPLSRLPLEILRHIAGYLDSFTLSQLSQVSRLIREVCATLLQERGMVSLKWEKKTYSHGRSSWKCKKKVWEFSSLFTSVDRWSFSNTPSMSDHLKTCCFYQRKEHTEPVALACLGEVRDKYAERRRR